MTRVALAVFVLVGLLLPSHAAAKRRYKVEITPHLGYSFGGAFGDGSYNGSEVITFSDLNIDDGLDAGIAVDVPVSRSLQLEALYNRQATKLQLKELVDEDLPLLDLSVNYWHFGLLYQYPQRSIFPFGTIHAGVTRFSPKENFDGMTKFSWALGLGVKSYVSRNVGVRFQIRGIGTYITASDQTFCDPSGFCYDYPKSTWMWQGELTGGLIIAL